MMKQLLTIFYLFLPLVASAFSFTDGTFAYNINKDKQSVTVVANTSTYSGDLVIPATVTDNGQTYQVTEIGESAFKNCTRLYSIQFPEGLKVINYSAFEGCTGLESVKLPNSIEDIPYSCFKGCRLLERVEFGTGVKIIHGSKEGYTGYGAFEDCTSLVSVSIPSSVTDIYATAFRGCSALETVSLPEGLVFIGSNCFQNCSSLTSITIPSTVTKLGAGLFLGCKSLERAVLGSGIQTMGDELFKGCQALEKVTIKKGCATISPMTFQGCISLTEITIPGSVEDVGYSAFLGCRALEKVTLERGILVIHGNREGYTGSGAFEDCISLESIEIPSTVTDIYASAFRGCTSLSSVTLSKGLLSIGSSCFQNCSSLKSITIPSTVNTLGASMFKGCNSLETSILGKGITTMGDELFKGCSALKEVTIEKGCGVIAPMTFQNCTSLTSVSIPGSVTDVGYSAFQGCKSLVTVSMEKGVTTIHGNRNGYTGSGAFEDCTSLEEVVFPSSIASIYASAFRNCSSLKRLTIQATVLPEMGTNVFQNASISEATLYVPEKSLEKYRAAESWSQFGTIMAIGGEAPSSEWYMKTDDGTMIPMKQVGMLVAADDDIYFAVLDANGNFIHNSVKRARFLLVDPVGIKPDSQTEQSDILKRLVNNQLTIVGVSSPVEVYNMAGFKVLDTQPTGKETVVNVGTLPTGTYIVKCGRQSFKFMKK